MSKQRAQARAERVTAAAVRAEAAQRRAARRTDRQRRRSARRQLWRRIRLWQSGPQVARNRERWAALTVAVLVVLLLTYLFTSSLTAVGLMILVTVIATPALIAVVTDRSKR